MRTEARLKIAGGVLSVLLLGTTYQTIRRKKRNQRASLFLGELSKILNPADQGLSGEQAFDTKYTDRVLNTVMAQVLILKKSTATGFAKEIYQAFQPWYKGGDDEAKVYGVFRNLKDKVQVSQVAQAYNEVYGVHLMDQLKERFDTEEIKKVLGIVKQLPTYRKL